MRKYLTIILILLAVRIAASNTISIPLSTSGGLSLSEYLSTPDPTDPNQFRASLTGNTLVIQTPANAVSYVLIREAECERRNEDYFYSISLDSVSCPINRAGTYAIQIGCWDKDYVGYLLVKKVGVYDLNGRYWGATLDKIDELPEGYYLIRVETNMGTTCTKFYVQQ